MVIPSLPSKQPLHNAALSTGLLCRLFDGILSVETMTLSSPSGKGI